MSKKDDRLLCVVLAAGLGTRMKSARPKVLHEICGRPMLQYVLDAAAGLKPTKIVVVTGDNGQAVAESLSASKETVFSVQKKQNGTADAVLAAKEHFKGFSGTVLVINGDSPLITEDTLKKFLSKHKRNSNNLSFISFDASNPAAYGRVVRDDNGKPVKIVEKLDATPAERNITEVNSGVYAFEPPALSLLSKIEMNKKKGEYYLTDVVSLVVSKGLSIDAYILGDEYEFHGINTRAELAVAGEIIRQRVVNKWLSSGVSFVDTSSVHIEPSATIGQDTLIYPNTYIQGATKIGKGCTIYPNARIVDSTLKDGAVVKDSSLVEESEIGPEASVGPFAHLRPGSKIGKSAKIGNFVEVKASTIGEGSKAMHLTYIGDAEVGSKVNVGAGTITCNYDGVKKHKTKIGDGAFIGSDTQLVAPVEVGKDSYIGAGTTVTKFVPPGHLATSRTRQRNIEFKPRKKK